MSEEPSLRGSSSTLTSPSRRPRISKIIQRTPPKQMKAKYYSVFYRNRPNLEDLYKHLDSHRDIKSALIVPKDSTGNLRLFVTFKLKKTLSPGYFDIGVEGKKCRAYICTISNPKLEMKKYKNKYRNSGLIQMKFTDTLNTMNEEGTRNIMRSPERADMKYINEGDSNLLSLIFNRRVMEDINLDNEEYFKQIFEIERRKTESESIISSKPLILGIKGNMCSQGIPSNTSSSLLDNLREGADISNISYHGGMQMQEINDQYEKIYLEQVRLMSMFQMYMGIPTSMDGVRVVAGRDVGFQADL